MARSTTQRQPSPNLGENPAFTRFKNPVWGDEQEEVDRFPEMAGRSFTRPENHDEPHRMQKSLALVPSMGRALPLAGNQKNFYQKGLNPPGQPVTTLHPAGNPNPKSKITWPRTLIQKWKLKFSQRMNCPSVEGSWMHWDKSQKTLEKIGTITIFVRLSTTLQKFPLYPTTWLLMGW